MENELILYSVNAIRSMEVIDVSTGSKIGYTRDFKVDLDSQSVVSIILPPIANNGWFSRGEDIEIPWDKVVKVGLDVLLVNAEGLGFSNGENII